MANLAGGKDTRSFEVYPIGRVRKAEKRVWLEIDPAYADGMLGLDGFSHIIVFYWFHENDTPADRSLLQVRPRKDPKNPLTGVFATHSPRRPNLIALTRCRILDIRDHCIFIDEIDAHDNSPLIDIKCYIPDNIAEGTVKVPDWV